MRKKFYLLLAFFIFSALLTAQKKPFEIADLYRVKTIGSPSVSPSGDKAAYTLTDYNLFEGKSNTDIYIYDASAGESKNISSDKRSDSSPMWLSDNQLYFMSGSKLYLYDLKNGSEQLVIESGISISNPVLSPDGKYIAFTAELYPECGIDIECNQRIRKAADEGPAQAFIADDLLFRHWTEYDEERETHIILYDIKNNSFKDLTASAWASDRFKLGGDTKYAFSPDGKELCFISSDEEDLASTTNSDLYIIPISGGVAANITSENKAWDGSPAYSPDGNYIAYKLQKMVDFEADRYRIALYDRRNKSVSIITENFDYTIDEIKWTSDSKSIYFTADYQGYAPLYKLDISTKAISEVSGRIPVIGFDFMGNDIIFRSSRTDRPYELYKISGSGGEKTQLTFFNKELLEEVDFRPAEEMWVEGADGKKVHVFIVKPHNFDPNKKYPVVLNVHGGPQSQWMDVFRGDWQVYPGAGYVVAFPNPHGSTGYGSAFTEAISGDWGGKVYEDLMKVTDELEKLPYVDKDRIGAMGWSYGGYMMNWFQAQTDRYKCLVSMMGIFDLESMWGATEELWFVNWDLKGQPWNSDIYEKYSPSNYVENFSTPALIIAGKKDYRVPYSQSVQYFTTLQFLGIDSRLLIFEKDGHWPSHIKSMPVYYNAHLEWFHKYLGGGKAPYDSKEMIKNVGFENKTSN